MDTKTESYPSKVDTWLVVTVVLILLAVLISAGVTSWKAGDFRALWFVLICEMMTVGLMLLISCPLRYQLSAKKVVVQSGVMRIEVPVDKITGIQKTRSLISAPAWSLDRVKIDYDNDGYAAYVIISPKEREKFIKQLGTYQQSSQ